MDIRAVAIGQDDLKTELKNDISAVTDEISALETKINAGHEEFRRETSDFQERIRNIETGQAAFEERVTYTVDTQLRDMSSMVEQQTRNLREDLSRNIEATRRGFETQLTALQVRTRRAGAGNAGTNTDKVKPSSFSSLGPSLRAVSACSPSIYIYMSHKLMFC
jgi:hypothetical protein